MTSTEIIDDCHSRSGRFWKFPEVNIIPVAQTQIAEPIMKSSTELCGGKKVNTDEDENSMKDFDLALNPLHAKDDRKDKRQIQQQASELKRQEEQNKLLLERLKTQKRQGATGVQRGQQHKARKGKANKKEFAQSYAQHDELWKHKNACRENNNRSKN